MTIVKAAAPRLSDEDPDPIEQDENENVNYITSEGVGWLSWDADDIADIKRLIANKMLPESKKILNAFLLGLSYNDIHVSEKFWRYHFNVGLQFLKKEMGLRNAYGD